MKSFAGKLAVVTGGGSGIGRALVRQLAREGCSVAVCDLNAESAAETVALAMTNAPAGVRVTSHVTNVADEASLSAARDEIAARHGTDHINLLFNNAGIAGAGSFVTDDREAWERVFAICWGGVYNGCRTFLPMLIASDEGYIVNTSSINAVWPKHGPGMPSTSYGTAKYAVKGFSEALIEDLRTHAPHVKVAVVMPGSVATNLADNSTHLIGTANWMKALPDARARLLAQGAPVENATDAQLRAVEASFFAAMTAFGYVIGVEEVAAAILAGVHEGRWRITTGIDARRLDRLVSEDPDGAFDPDGTSLTPRWLLMLITLRVLLDPAALADFSASFGFRFGADDPVGVRVDAGDLVFLKSPEPSATATLVLKPPVLRALILGTRTLSEALDAGDLTIEGDRQAAEHLFTALTPKSATE